MTAYTCTSLAQRRAVKTTRERYFIYLPKRPHWSNLACGMPNYLMVEEIRSSDTPDFAILNLTNNWSPLQQFSHYRATL